MFSQMFQKGVDLISTIINKYVWKSINKNTP